jgi:hypothetical protein
MESLFYSIGHGTSKTKKIKKGLTKSPTPAIIKTDKTKEDKKMTEYMEMILTGASFEDLLKEAEVEVEEFEEA